MTTSAGEANTVDDSSFFSKLPIFDTKVKPLFSALANGKAVVYVGAGASIPAKLPSWKQLLERCIHELTQTPEQAKQWALTKRLIERGDLMLAAEMLQTTVGDHRLNHEFIEKTFGAASVPTEVHRMIAKLPFSIALTTNYDHLLEGAYRETLGAAVRKYTWNESKDFFNAIRQRSFAVVKTHGEFDKPQSLVLAKSAYYKLMMESDAFNACFEDLLLYRTFLFVGCSLSDDDLMEKMARGKKMFDKFYGPHYAILFDEDVDEPYKQFLEDTYAIHVISAKPTASEIEGVDERTMSVRNVLQAIRRDTQIKTLELSRVGFPAVPSSPLLSVSRDAGLILEHIVRLTGSLRGDVSLVRSPSVQRLFRVAEFTVGRNMRSIQFPQAWHEVPNEIKNRPSLGQFTVTESLFLQKRRTFVYLPNVEEQSALEKQGFKNSKYYPCDDRVKSELAASIISDGVHVGVLNIESELYNGYTEGHLAMLRAGADQIGRLFSEARRRTLSAHGLTNYCIDSLSDNTSEVPPGAEDTKKSHFEAFSYLLGKSRDLVLREMRFLLFKTDHYADRLIGYWDRSQLDMFQGKRFTYPFESDSLAVACAKQEARITIPNVKLAIEQKMMSQDGVTAFNIEGPCEARPVVCAGDVAGVLVCWSRSADLQKPDAFPLFQRMAERAYRVVKVIGNDPLSLVRSEFADRGCIVPRGLDVSDFLNELHKNLKSIDGGSPWSDSKLRKSSFRADVFKATLNALVHPSVGLGRVRLWVKESNSPIQFQCVASDYAPGYSPKSPIQYDGLISSENDPYCAYTVARWPTDPYAQPQHRSMFPGFTADPNSNALQKDPDGGWIVAPIGWDDYEQGNKNDRSTLSGFISADCHLQEESGPRSRLVSTIESTYHQCALDVVSHVIAAATHSESVHRVLKKKKSL